MPRNSLEDATAKALDLLPHDDAARSDPRLVRDAKCLEEIRATQETAADLWLATSPLRAAPPEVLSSIMSKVEARTPLAHRNVKFFPWLAASGWVAASIAFLLWPRDGEKSSAVATVDPPVYMRKQAAHGEVAVAPAEDAGLPGLPDRRAVSGDRRIREDLLRLQAQMKSLAEQGALDAPRVLGLRSPNALQQKPEEAQRRVIAVLADALGSLLEMDGGAMGDPASIVLQRGWVPDGFIPSEGTYIRHLNFPATAAEDYDLLVSEDGAYYDPARQMIWSLDENGRGYLGRRVTGEDNLNAYYTPDEDTLAANRAMALAMRAEPEGFLIEDPKSNSAKVLIDQVPPPAAGYEQVVVWTDAAGHETRIPVQNTSVTAAATTPAPSPMPMPLAVAPMSAAPLATAPTTQDVSAAPLASIPVLPSLAQVGAGRLFFSLPDSNGVKSFSLIELPIVANGVQQPKVIVSGERPGNGNAKANGNANGSQKGNGNGKANGNGNGNGKARGKLK